MACGARPLVDLLTRATNIVDDVKFENRRAASAATLFQRAAVPRPERLYLYNEICTVREMS